MQIYADWSSSQYTKSQPVNQKQMMHKQKLIPTYALYGFRSTSNNGTTNNNHIAALEHFQGS